MKKTIFIILGLLGAILFFGCTQQVATKNHSELFVGNWVDEAGVFAKQYFADGTGKRIGIGLGGTVDFNWKLKENNILQEKVDSSLQWNEYKYSFNGDNVLITQYIQSDGSPLGESSWNRR